MMRIAGYLPAVMMILVAMATGQAAAHAVLVSAIPGDGQILTSAPTGILLHFNEPVVPVQVRVISQATGQPVTQSSDVQAVDQDIRIALPKALAQGGYIISYRVISTDSHPVAGAFPFGIGAAPAALLPRGEGSNDFWQVATFALRVVRDLGVLTTAGGVLFLLFIGVPQQSDRAVRHFLIALSIGLAIVGAASIGAEGAMLAEAPFIAILAPAVWHLGWTTSLGTSASLSIVGSILMTVGLAVRWRLGGLTVATGGALLAIAGFAVTGHAATASPVVLMAPTMVIHTAAIAFWIGSLWPLHTVLRRERNDIAAPVVATFSRMAATAVLALLAAGMVLAVVQVRSVAALGATEYGKFLLLKLAMVATLLFVALDNRRRLSPAIAKEGSWVSPALRRAIEIELVLAAGILLATGFLGEVTPPRAADEMEMDMPMDVEPAAEPAGYSATVALGSHRAIVHLAPARAGRNQLEIRLEDADGKPFDVKEITVDLANSAAGVEAIERMPTLAAPGVYRVDGSEFALAGLWEVAIRALIDDFTIEEFDTEIPVQ